MAAGDCTISGAYHFNSTEIAAAQGFVNSGKCLSGGSVFSIPSGEDSFYIGIVAGA